VNAVSNTVAAGAAALALVTIVAIFPLLHGGASRLPPAPIAADSVGAAQLRGSKSEAAKPAPSATVDDNASLHSRVERLLVPGTPRGRYQAFAMLAQCAHAIDFDRYLKALPADAESARLRDRYGDGSARVAAACGDLSARQLEQRVELAASAADEGIPGAASAWVEEGPYGDKTALTQRPDDPLIIEWAQQAIARVNAATKRADTEAISQFGMLCLNWEMDDVARVRLLVDDALERQREDQMKRVLDRAPPG
jgi:hypothetical protein